MKYRGVVYDVGLNFTGDGFSVEPFNPNLVEHDMRAIRQDLYANAVRIEGEEIHRLETAARIAHAMGLTVLFNPWKMNADVEDTRSYMELAAITAEKLRSDGVDIVFVAGCEYTIFSKGVFPGNNLNERLQFLTSHFADAQSMDKMPEPLVEKSVKLNKILGSFVEVIRANFKGLVTYSAGLWEKVEWDIFDIVGVDYYRHGETEEQYVAGLERYRSADKPFLVMEVGCCAYEGAAARGAGGFMVLKGRNPDGSGIFEDGVVPTRSEREQADYVGTQLGLLADANVQGVFIYVFSFPCMPTGEGASDLDLACYSLVKTFPNSDTRSKSIPPWAPKESFQRVAEIYRSMTELEEK
ncbi:hypothetical protein BJY04DRAFT_179118 [Aspergillus karnatakaensis]|uniref:uncharacterized protein n=1 Tax=Aspergillus karnatakaensis TaxID=1810916 RepID=UPI003CCDB0AF